MSFDESAPDWNEDSMKWRRYVPSVIPAWTAALDFRSPPAIVNALQRRVAKGMFDYAVPARTTVEAIVNALARRYNWSVDPEAIVFVPGLVPAQSFAINAFSDRDDEVLFFSPAYPPFFGVPTNNHRVPKPVPLVLDKITNTFEIDWDATARLVAPKTKIFLWCHPHNPTGRAWQREELEKVAAFCIQHNLTLVSDEIWCDLVLDSDDHIPAASLNPEISARTITLMAPSKTFNLAGMTTGFAVVTDPQLRRRFAKAAESGSPLNSLGLAACEAAYTDPECETWRQGLLQYLRDNREFLMQTLATDLPDVHLEARIQSTYLAWLNVGDLHLPKPGEHFEAHGVAMVDGKFFGASPGQYVRLNFGCHRSTLTEILKRMMTAIQNVNR